MGKVYSTSITPQHKYLLPRMLGVKSTDFITVKDVPCNQWISEFAKYLKKGNKIAQPDWTVFAKTAAFKELAPSDPDWLYVRAAAVMRKLYLRPCRGISQLANDFGGKRRNGGARKHHARGARGCVRYCLMQLEKANLVEKVTKDGLSRRKISSRGQTDMNRIAQAISNAEK